MHSGFCVLVFFSLSHFHYYSYRLKRGKRNKIKEIVSGNHQSYLTSDLSQADAIQNI